jgi:ElaB/YqjD/DUF883 family membrane-anchored ribosome-binding protein
MAYEDTARSTVQEATDQGRNAAEQATRTVKDGYKAARQYAEDQGLNIDVDDFVRRQPWLAVAAAVAIGFVAAQMFRRIA